MRPYLLLCALLTTGCSSPLQPSGPLVIPAELQRAWTFIDRDIPPNVRAVVIESLPPGRDGEWRPATGTIVLVPAVVGFQAEWVAGLLMHELRHADGVMHDCSGERDRRRDGAWTAHADFLDRVGLPSSATWIRANQFCQ